ncbi:ankyrin repeat domain-containing protein [Kaarinaea lacus]
MKKKWLEATQCGDCDKVRQLLNEGEDINALDEHGQTALMNAAHHGDFNLVKLLIEHGADLNRSAKYSLTALMLAVINSHKEIVRALVDAGANTELAGSKPFKCTPLKYAEGHGLDEIIEILKTVPNLNIE